jgi:uncharacterized membrane protein YqjE
MIYYRIDLFLSNMQECGKINICDIISSGCYYSMSMTCIKVCIVRYYLYIINIVWCKCKCRQSMKTIIHVCMTASFHGKWRIWKSISYHVNTRPLNILVSTGILIKKKVAGSKYGPNPPLVVKWIWQCRIFLFYIIFKTRLCQVGQTFNKCFTDLFCEYTLFSYSDDIYICIIRFWWYTNNITQCTL